MTVAIEMRLGIGSYAFPWAIGVPGYPSPEKPLGAMGLLKKAKALAADVVQICDNLPLHNANKGELDELRDAANDIGIRIQIGTRGIRPGHLLIYLEIAKLLGAKILRTTINEPDLKPTIKQAAASIIDVLPKFAGAGISIALENHESYRSRELVNLVEGIHSPNLGICLDTVNSFGALEGPEQTITELAPYALSLHVKDFDVVRVGNQMGFMIVGRPAGEGHLDIEWLFDRVLKEGKEPDAILELWTPFSDGVEDTIHKEEEWASRSMQFLRGKVG